MNWKMIKGESGECKRIKREKKENEITVPHKIDVVNCVVEFV